MTTTLSGRSILTRAMAIVMVTGGLVALPATSWPAPSPEPVTPEIEAIAVDGVDEKALSDAPEPDTHDTHTKPAKSAKPLEPAVVTEEIETGVEFGLVGVVFDEAPPEESVVQVRVKEDDGWSGWKDLPLNPGHGPDRGDPDFKTVKPMTEPLLTNPASEVQVRVDTPGGEAPEGTQVKVVEAKEAPADDFATASGPALATANAAADQPAIISRAAWGANENLRNGCPGLTDAAKVAFVHHTASSSNYSTTGAASQLRAIYGWATSNGYCDMPYNFMVDRYGKIYEGRGGGVSLPVKSGATASFNAGSVSVSALGNFTTAPSNGFWAMKTSIAQLIGWKLALTNRSAAAQETLVAEGYPGGVAKGQPRTFNRISGHLDAFPTACPGDALYPQLGGIRTLAAGYQGAITGSWVASPGSPTKYRSNITQWSKTNRRRKTYYRSSFVVTPGAGRTVYVKKKIPGNRWANGKKWKISQHITVNSAGYANFKLRARKKTKAFRLVAPKTSTARYTHNQALYLTRKKL